MDALKAAALRASIAEYAQRFIGLPYVWGGDDPILGFDCSGLVMEVMQAHGVFPRGTDLAARHIYARLHAQGCRSIAGLGYAGCLVFWYTEDDGDITHVAIMVDNEHIVHAAGGGSRVTNADEAAKYNAYIRKDRIDYRGENYIILDPIKTDGIL